MEGMANRKMHLRCARPDMKMRKIEAGEDDGTENIAMTKSDQM